MHGIHFVSVYWTFQKSQRKNICTSCKTPNSFCQSTWCWCFSRFNTLCWHSEWYLALEWDCRDVVIQFFRDVVIQYFRDVVIQFHRRVFTLRSLFFAGFCSLYNYSDRLFINFSQEDSLRWFLWVLEMSLQYNRLHSISGFVHLPTAKKDEQNAKFRHLQEVKLGCNNYSGNSGLEVWFLFFHILRPFTWHAHCLYQPNQTFKFFRNPRQPKRSYHK